MPIEKLCPKCGKFFYYEDGANPQCLQCYDPHTVPGETYRKKTLLNCLRVLLESRGVNTTEFQDEQLIEMLREFPIAYQLYTTTTYFTFTLPTDATFSEEKFRLGSCIASRRDARPNRRGQLKLARIVYCNRCGRKAIHGRLHVLFLFTGMNVKYCARCDSHLIPRNTAGLLVPHDRNRNGSKKRDDSMRAKAKSLNISLYEYRKGVREPRTLLQDGTIIADYKILSSFWDDTHNQYCPKYLVQCIHCGQKFAVSRSKLERLSHACLATNY